MCISDFSKSWIEILAALVQWELVRCLIDCHIELKQDEMSFNQMCHGSGSWLMALAHSSDFDMEHLCIDNTIIVIVMQTNCYASHCSNDVLTLNELKCPIRIIHGIHSAISCLLIKAVLNFLFVALRLTRWRNLFFIDAFRHI